MRIENWRPYSILGRVTVLMGIYKCKSVFLYDVSDEWLSLIEECLAHEVQSIREKAIIALPLVFDQYLRDGAATYGDMDTKQKRTMLVEKHCDQLASTGVNGLVLRMGYARAVGKCFNL